MLKFLLPFLAPGTKLPEGAGQVTLSTEGLSWGWAFFLFVLLTAAVSWSYWRYASRLTKLSRIGLITLRSILIAMLLLILVHPVILLTLEESTRRPLLVLLDVSQSMELKDHRTDPKDLARAALAKGLIEPGAGVDQPAPVLDPDLVDASRRKIVEDVAANPKLNLWSAIYANANLHFYGVGKEVRDIGELRPKPGQSQLMASEAADFFKTQKYDDNLSALGDGLQQVLDQQRGQPLAGILLITDGANNSGTPPVEAAKIAHEDGVPLFIYGVGITSPKDIFVSEINGPPTSNVKEKVVFNLRMRAQNLVGQTAKIQLKANGKVVDEQAVQIRADGDQEVSLGYTPTEVGDYDIEAVVLPLAEESAKDNNSVLTRLKVVDTKTKVLIIQQEPNWDFQYLMTMLQRDRRIKVKACIINGDAGMSTGPESDFLDTLPADKAALLDYDVIILGDANPDVIGKTRMEAIAELVNKLGGGLIFMTGSKGNLAAYADTPLGALLPVDLDRSDTREGYAEPVVLRLTPAGESSGLLTLSENPVENTATWKKFPGVTRTAKVIGLRPGAQALMVDPTESRATRLGLMPVMALESYGLGKTLYIGFNETYRWRSKNGEKYYSRIWGQVIQIVGAQKTQGNSGLIQLKSDKPRYFTGNRVIISARAFKQGFEPLDVPELTGTLVIKPKDGQGDATSTKLHLQPVPDKPGEYASQFISKVPGSYSYSVERDPGVVLKFDVADLKVEMADTAMNEKLLQAMASTAGGRFLREENLSELPSLISSKSSGVVTFKKIDIMFSPYLLALMILAACLEWFWRRHRELK